MSRIESYGAQLKLQGTEGLSDLQAKEAAARSEMLELVDALSKGELSTGEYAAQSRAAAAEVRIYGQAIKALEAEQRSLAASEAAAAAEFRAMGAAVQARAHATVEALAEEEAAIRSELTAYEAAKTAFLAEAAAKRQAAADDAIAEQSEREAMAIAHETEMLAHEARQLTALEAVQDREIATLGQQISQEGRATAAAQQLTTATAAAAAAAIRDADAVVRQIQATDKAEAEALQFANAIYAEETAMGSFTATVNGAATGITLAGTAAGQTRGGMGNLQQSIIAGSYAFQDFTGASGDLGMKLNSITNNLPMLLSGLGGLGIALSVAGTAAVAVYRNWDSIAGLWESRSPFPKAAHDLDSMKRELDSTKESLEKFEKAGTGNTAQIEQYNQALARTVQLKKQIADEEERQQLLTKSLEGKTEEQEGRGKAYEEATKGRGQEYLDQITAAYKKDLDEQVRNAQLRATLAIQAYEQEDHTEAEKRKFAAEQWATFQDAVRVARGNDPAKLAAQLHVELLKGQENAGKELKRLMDETGMVWHGLAERMEALNPMTKKKNAELNAQGQEGERAALDELKAIQKTARDELKVHLDEMKELGGIDAAAKELYEQGKAKGLGGQQLLESIRAGLAPRIQGALGVRGFRAPRGVDVGQQEAVEDTAREAAQRAVKAAPKAEAKVEAKDWAAEFAEAKDQLEAEIKATEARDKAEAKRVLERFGDQAADLLQEALADQANGDPEQIAREMVLQITRRFRTEGARPEAANLAARQVAAKAGFAVERTAPRQQVAQRPVIQPGRKPRVKQRVAVAPRPKANAKPPAVAQAKPPVKPAPPPAAPAETEAHRRMREQLLREQAAQQKPDTVGPQAAATNQAGLNAAGQQAAATAALQATLRQQQLAYDQVAKRLNQITRSIQSDQGTAQNSGTQVS